MQGRGALLRPVWKTSHDEERHIAERTIRLAVREAITGRPGSLISWSGRDSGLGKPCSTWASFYGLRRVAGLLRWRVTGRCQNSDLYPRIVRAMGFKSPARRLLYRHPATASTCLCVCPVTALKHSTRNLCQVNISAFCSSAEVFTGYRSFLSIASFEGKVQGCPLY